MPFKSTPGFVISHGATVVLAIAYIIAFLVGDSLDCVQSVIAAFGISSVFLTLLLYRRLSTPAKQD